MNKYRVFVNVTRPDEDVPPRWEELGAGSYPPFKPIEAPEPWDAVLRAHGGARHVAFDRPLVPGQYLVVPVDGSAAFRVGLDVRLTMRDGEPVQDNRVQ